MPLRRFVGWMTFSKGGTQYIAIMDFDSNWLVYDRDCQFYGKWADLDPFRKLTLEEQQKLCLGKNLLGNAL